MNNDPVGYVSELPMVEGENLNVFRRLPAFDGLPSGTQLYTHPIRELTDEEIIAIRNNIGWSQTEDFYVRLVRSCFEAARKPK